jgi:transposase
MTKQFVEVITSVERRRRWSLAEKERLVAATLEPGARVSEIARSAGVHGSQLFRWRRDLCRISAPSVPQLIPVDVVDPLPAPAVPRETQSVSGPRQKASRVMIELGGGRRLRIESDIDAQALGRILDVLERRPVCGSTECKGG